MWVFTVCLAHSTKKGEKGAAVNRIQLSNVVLVYFRMKYIERVESYRKMNQKKLEEEECSYNSIYIHPVSFCIPGPVRN